MGPDLSGAGAMGTESLLRNILTPNAQLESGYYRHDITLKDGSFLSGFVPAQDDKSLTLRQIGADERVVAKSDIKTSSCDSELPEQDLDHLVEGKVTDPEVDAEEDRRPEDNSGRPDDLLTTWPGDLLHF